MSPGCRSAKNTRLVGLGAGMGLDIGEGAVEQLAGALNGEGFGHVHILAAAIIAPAGIAFGVFVGHDRALRLQHGARDDVFRGDQLDFVLLAVEFAGDGLGDLWIGLGELFLEEAGEQGSFLCLGFGGWFLDGFLACLLGHDGPLP